MGERTEKRIRGFRRFTTPFAPDQSGAVSVLYDMGGISVVCDAGGCTGNICGFDEPRWFKERSAVFSAGLRDMDAILGRDDRLVEKLAEAAQQTPARFAAVIGTPVPAVIGTDYRALCRMAEKKTGLPVLGINTDGMEYYDRGIEKTYLALLKKFCRRKDGANGLVRAESGFVRQQSVPSRIIGVWGFTPLDFAGILTADELKSRLRDQGFDEILCCGAGTDIEALKDIRKAEKNLVVSPAGAAAAVWLEKEYGTPWEYGIPGGEALMEIIFKKLSDRSNGDNISDGMGKVLVVHQQVLADRIRRRLEEAGIYAVTAGFFMMNKDLLRGEDSVLREEADLYKLVLERGFDCVIADRALEPVLAGLRVKLIPLPHFAVSGDLS
nr:nitrogenase component 1 [Sarcina sp. DSM 11001]